MTYLAIFGLLLNVGSEITREVHEGPYGMPKISPYGMPKNLGRLSARQVPNPFILSLFNPEFSFPSAKHTDIAFLGDRVFLF